MGLTLAGIGQASAATTQCVGCFAVVDSNGTLLLGNGVARAAKLGDGQYEVIFNKLVTKCAYSTTLGRTGAVPFPVDGEIAAIGHFSSNKGVMVQTFQSGGSPFSDKPFHLVLTCKPN